MDKSASKDGPSINGQAPDVETADVDLLKKGNGVDEAFQALARHGPLELTPEKNRALLRKIDWNLMPMLCVVYMLNFLDKTTLSYASIMGFRTDLHLKGDNYEWLGSMFYIGYLFWEFPTNRLLQRLPLGKYSGVNIILWGSVLCCTAATTNFAGAAAVRFLLGVFEAGVTPGFALFTSQWYTQTEQASRIGIWFGFNGIAQIVGGALASGIARGVARYGSAIPGWKVMFVAIGLLTVAIGIVFFFVMPDSQMNARFLNEEEKLLAIERIRGNQQGVGNRTFKWYQFREAFADPMKWAFAFHGATADIPNGGVSNFFSILVKGFGFSSEESLLYGGIAGAVQIVTLVGWGMISTRYGHRVLISAAILLFSIMGMLLVICLPSTNSIGRLIGLYFTAAQAAPLVCLLSLISANIAGYTKKTTVAAIYLISYCIGNIIGPQTFREKDAPRYLPAEITIVVCWGACVLNLCFISWFYKNQNVKKAAIRAQDGYQVCENAEFLDLTDRENPEFHYVY